MSGKMTDNVSEGSNICALARFNGFLEMSLKNLLLVAKTNLQHYRKPLTVTNTAGFEYFINI